MAGSLMNDSYGASSAGPKVIHVAKKINGVHTELIISFFKDRMLVAITQVGKLGTLIEVSKSNNLSGSSSNDVIVRLGRRDDPLLLVYARQIQEQIGDRAGLPVVLSIAVTDRSPSTFQAIINILLKEIF